VHRSLLCLAAVALLTVACDNAPSAPPPADLAPSLAKGGEDKPAHEHYRAPFARTVANPCPPVPEAVAVEGFTQFNAHFKFFDGGNTSRVQMVTQAQGIGAITGVKYTFHELMRQRSTYQYSTSVYQVDQMIRWHVVSATSLGNFFATSHQKITCDATGCRTEPISFETDCRG
jgi:hypothetical protein